MFLILPMRSFFCCSQCHVWWIEPNSIIWLDYVCMRNNGGDDDDDADDDMETTKWLSSGCWVVQFRFGKWIISVMFFFVIRLFVRSLARWVPFVWDSGTWFWCAVALFVFGRRSSYICWWANPIELKLNVNTKFTWNVIIHDRLSSFLFDHHQTHGPYSVWFCLRRKIK